MFSIISYSSPLDIWSRIITRILQSTFSPDHLDWSHIFGLVNDNPQEKYKKDKCETYPTIILHMCGNVVE